MQDGARGSGGERGRARVGEPGVSAPGRARRHWSDEDKARVVRASLRPGERVGEVARRYGVSRGQLSVWRGLARKGKLAVASSTGAEAEPVGVAREPEREPAFATLEVDAAPEPGRGSLGSVSIEARGVTVRLDGDIGAGRIAEVASVLRALR